MTLESRFWSRVQKGPGCWLWKIYKGDGYGRIKHNEKTSGAHRVSWEIHNGPIPKNLLVLHKCDVHACVNPDHLFLGTYQQNTQDMISKKRHNTPQGERHWKAKLTEKDVLNIYKDSRQNCDLAKIYGVHHSIISKIKHRRIWKHLTEEL